MSDFVSAIQAIAHPTDWNAKEMNTIMPQSWNDGHSRGQTRFVLITPSDGYERSIKIDVGLNHYNVTCGGKSGTNRLLQKGGSVHWSQVIVDNSTGPDVVLTFSRDGVIGIPPVPYSQKIGTINAKALGIAGKTIFVFWPNLGTPDYFNNPDHRLTPYSMGFKTL
ncbi:hypothetical protein SAMD00019534_095510 [Acytostelium subglobosum LB1]|uniref:hypothetical protein n=1 Tax=Acytostelium subglobosum LB1 TaxID=1410327 RepID=UPI000644EA7D|nr:hypothetical protein SAMD00019534_095510 [Acytostelium subglobosum LB1]GAM26376.1 hypothetical protein SAMD00019534_095510 [Acytostelium subglobosum LB1]|eukprot:XP_012750472.1 hypothetical protein SAMD00019534_095510 [Acytostelium subglobosum LB1]